jgi:hypothetical protein
MFFLLYLEDPTNAFIDIIRGFDLRYISNRSHSREATSYGSAYRCRQVEHRLSCNEGFFMVVLNFHIDDMYDAIEFTPS